MIVADFYPRPPRGGRHLEPAAGHHPAADFYPRPPRGGRRAGLRGAEAGFSISIHALREEGDEFSLPVCVDVEEFLSTPSARRATSGTGRRGGMRRISIHALREEGDMPTGGSRDTRDDFYPRPPRGGRRLRVSRAGYPREISIHALREEGDSMHLSELGNAS